MVSHASCFVWFLVWFLAGLVCKHLVCSVFPFFRCWFLGIQFSIYLDGFDGYKSDKSIRLYPWQKPLMGFLSRQLFGTEVLNQPTSEVLGEKVSHETCPYQISLYAGFHKWGYPKWMVYMVKLKLNIFQFAMQQITDPKKCGKTKSWTSTFGWKIMDNIWVNYHISQTWIVPLFGDDSQILTMIPGLGRDVRSLFALARSHPIIYHHILYH